ncbi:MAG: DUF4339 domain-containing protein [Myxococcaceae bacterium]|nr:DUF4339 domain-containing protein [Myxococcaceae bacterium]
MNTVPDAREQDETRRDGTAVESGEPTQAESAFKDAADGSEAGGAKGEGNARDTNPKEQSAPRRAEPRFHVRPNGGGSELDIADFAELLRLYRAGFIGDEDEIRRAGTELWRRAGQMPELRTLRPRPWLEGNEFPLLAALLCAVTLVLILILR